MRCTGLHLSKLRATSALSGALVALAVALPASAQDSGKSCNMIGQACDLSANGANGTDGPAASGDKQADGNDGTLGTPGGEIVSTLLDTRALQSIGSTSPINAVSVGGRGGKGSDADAFGSIITNRRGGTGQPGQNGGLINLTVGPLLSGEAFLGSLGETTSGMTLISLGGQGGSGGLASFNYGELGNGVSGKGGDAGTVTATIAGQWTSAPGAGLFATSNGGQGGGGNTNTDAFNSPQGVDAAAGGLGNTVDITVNGTVAGLTYGAFIASIGGDGGVGGSSDDCCDRSGGAGGNGGAAANVSATLGSSGIAVANGNGAAFYVASLGGAGGVGGKSNSAGNGGVGGDAGTVTAVINGNVNTGGSANTYGVLVQSLGGAGGNGARSGAWFNPTSGSGNTGGKANTVSVTGTGAKINTGNQTNNADNAAAVLAQSIGGGGGTGPDSNGWFAVGGNGGTASNGSTVSVSFTNSEVTTWGFSSAAVQAQSIGGGGGKGGDAVGTGTIVNMVVGGIGGGGGAAGDANAALLTDSSLGGSSQIQTVNKHSPGLEIQSIGGGGGDGGAGYGKSYSLFYGASISVGGAGGAGGDGGTVNAARTENNSGQIETFDSDSYGIVGQSIGGGGGNGGASTAKSIVKSALSSEFPSQSLALATGGSGGVAGSATNVYLQSSGLVATIGGGSAGIVAQAIGGGGGNGGDASATASASGKNITLAVSVAHGGTGGAAGDGGDVEATNHGLVLTTGESAQGMLVQSIGGGGGNGGAGDAKTENGSSVLANQSDGDGSTPKSVGIAIGSAGSGGGAGRGFNATATNTGAILTLGDSAHGIEVQTIGGGGGNAGGGAASTSGDIQFGVSVGGSGGKGGDTYYTSNTVVTNSGTVVTFGADANAILAQSIGGGGGAGGKAGTNISGGKSSKDGGNGDASGIQSTLTAIEQNYTSKGVDAIGDYNSLTSVLAAINGLLGNGSLRAGLGGDDQADGLDDAAGSGGEDSDDNNAKSIGINVGIGGKGGSGGSAGFMTITNSGVAATMGKMADAIVAQSIGGGGGKGGAASTATSTDISGSVAVGGTGGSGGNGGEPYVNNQGQVYTIGALSAGIVAQSVGGGGGIGGASATTATKASSQLGEDSDNKTFSLLVSVGGNGGMNGIGEGARVDSSGTLETRGHDAIGIISQSIGGGGGIVKTLATDLDNAGGSATSSSSKDYALNFKFGGSNGASGNSGAAIVNTTAGGSITTHGDNAYGILAQSVSGGGGLALGGKPNGSSATDFFGSGQMTGSVNPGIDPNPDNNKGVQVTVGADITTSGQGAIGVFAQSVGGGGGIAGDTGWTQQLTPMGRASNHTGNGGDIVVAIGSGTTVNTSGSNTPAIIAQTVGGGGGWIANKQGAFVGSAGGSGIGGLISITVNGTVNATGPFSAGIVAQSTGGADNGGSGTGNPITITIGSTGKMSVGQTNVPTGPNGSSAGIYVANGGRTSATPNVVTNNGSLLTFGSVANAVAVYSTGGFTAVVNNGTMSGDILLQNGGGQGCFTNNGSLNAGDAVSVGACGVINNGAFNIKGSGTIGTTRIDGNFVQGPAGRLVVDTDHVSGTGDLLTVTGTASVGGTVEVRPSRVSNRPVTVLAAGGGLTVDPALSSVDNSQLFDFKAEAAGNTLVIQPSAHFTAAASTLGSNRRAAAGNLQGLFDGGASFDRGFTALLGINDDAGYARSLDTLSGQALGAIGAARIGTSRAFVGNLYGGCERHGVVGDAEGRCAWARAFYTATTQDENVDELGYHARSTGFQLGGQTELSDSWYLSGAVAYQHSQLHDNDHSARIEGDGVLGGVSLRYDHDRLELSGALDAGYGWYHSRRQIVLGGLADEARAKPNEWELGAHANAAYTFDLGKRGYARPYADLHVIYVHGDRFEETGNSPFNLAVDSQRQTAVAGGLGLEVGGRLPLKGGGALRPFASAGVEFASNSDWTTTARFVGQGGSDSFDIRTAAPGSYGRFAVGLELLGAKNVDVSLSYNPELGKDYVSHAGLAKLSYRF